MRVIIYQRYGQPQIFDGVLLTEVENAPQKMEKPVFVAEQVEGRFVGHPCDIDIKTTLDLGHFAGTVIDYHETERRKRNLCDTCVNDFATCHADPLFGIGEGNDNVYECSSHEVEDTKDSA